MRVLSPILNQVIYPVLGKAGYFRSRASASVVTYHGVLPEGYAVQDSFLDNTLISIDAFRSQLRLLKSKYNVISPHLFREWLRGRKSLPERAVLLTCDDGLLNNLTVMTALLQKEDLQCLFFLTGSSVADKPAMLWYIELYLMMREARKSAPVDWRGIRVPKLPADQETRRAQWLQLTDGLSELDAVRRAEFLGEAVQWWGLDREWQKAYLHHPLLRQRFQLLDGAQQRQLVEAGMTVGAHTLSHPVLSRQSDQFARREIAESKQDLENATGRSVWAMAYPYGNPAAVGDREFRFAKEAGYSCAFMNVPGDLASAGKFCLPRVHVTADMSWGQFEANVSGFHHALQQRIRPAQVSADSQPSVR